MNDQVIASLREALKLSPDNVPLRRHLADTLMTMARYAEAEQEYRQALSQSPDDSSIKLALARAFYQQDKNTQSLVIVEDLLKGKGTPAGTYVLHARLLLRGGHIERAVRQYKEALELDPSATDSELG